MTATKTKRRLKGETTNGAAGGDLIQLSFDYESSEISKVDARTLEKHAKQIVSALDKGRTAYVEMVMRSGEHLSLARDRLANHRDGTFGKWCKQRCGITYRTAYNMVRAYETFNNHETVSQYFDASTLYLLSSESCPEHVTEEVIKRAEAGEQIRRKDVRQMIKAEQPNDAENDLEEETDEGANEWSQFECLRDVRREVMRWKRVCPSDERHELKQILQAILDQLEKEQDEQAEA